LADHIFYVPISIVYIPHFCHFIPSYYSFVFKSLLSAVLRLLRIYLFVHYVLGLHFLCLLRSTLFGTGPVQCLSTARVEVQPSASVERLWMCVRTLLHYFIPYYTILYYTTLHYTLLHYFYYNMLHYTTLYYKRVLISP
jgi:hypothetical protein